MFCLFDLGVGRLRFGSLLEIWVWDLVLCWRLIMRKKRQERHLINLFYFDVFGYKGSTRKTKKMIRK